MPNKRGQNWNQTEQSIPIDLYSPICIIIFPERHHTVSEQDICQANESPRAKTKVQISTKKSKIPKLLGRLYCLKLQVLRKKLFLNCNINIYKRWHFFIWCSSETFAQVSEQQPASFASSSTKKQKGLSPGMAKRKPWRAGSEQLNTSNPNFTHFNMFGSDAGWLRAILSPTSVPHQLAWHRQEPPTPREGAVGNRSGELMQHSRLCAWAKPFVLRLQFQSQSLFKLLAL